MKSDFAIDGCISLNVMVNDTFVNQAIAIILHKLLQRTESEATGGVRIDSEPFAGNLRLEVHVRRGSEGDILSSG